MGLALLYYAYTTHFEAFMMIFGHLVLYTLPLAIPLLLAMAVLTLRLIARSPLLLILPVVLVYAV